MDDPGLIELCMMPYLLNIDMKSAFDVYVDNANRSKPYWVLGRYNVDTS